MTPDSPLWQPAAWSIALAYIIVAIAGGLYAIPRRKK